MEARCVCRCMEARCARARAARGAPWVWHCHTLGGAAALTHMCACACLQLLLRKVKEQRAELLIASHNQVRRPAWGWPGVCRACVLQLVGLAFKPSTSGPLRARACVYLHARMHARTAHPPPHTQESVEKAVVMMREMGLHPSESPVAFGQLLGMSDHLTQV